MVRRGISGIDYRRVRAMFHFARCQTFSLTALLFSVEFSLVSLMKDCCSAAERPSHRTHGAASGVLFSIIDF